MVFVVALGVLLHFAYEWSGDMVVFASISAVNESIWEHMKLLFSAVVMYGIIDFIILQVLKYIDKVKRRTSRTKIVFLTFFRIGRTINTLIFLITYKRVA